MYESTATALAMRGCVRTLTREDERSAARTIEGDCCADSWQQSPSIVRAAERSSSRVTRGWTQAHKAIVFVHLVVSHDCSLYYKFLIND